MRRREFIALFGVAALAGPRAARAQQADRVRRVGVLMSRAAGDPEEQARFAGFLQGLQKLGWTDGRNVRIDYRWAAADADRSRTYAAELVALAPDVILASGSTSVAALLQTTRTVPIVFVNVVDPVGAGYVARLARPGGNAAPWRRAAHLVLYFAGRTNRHWLEQTRCEPVCLCRPDRHCGIGLSL
jgi:putative ABC transport system substrate-binding protein